MSVPKDRTAELSARIVAYLEERPKATDTLLGIALFWLNADVTEVECALTELVRQGRLVTRQRAGKTYYLLPPGADGAADEASGEKE